MFNRLYHAQYGHLVGQLADAQARPWVAMCDCPWVTYHASQPIAFGIALKHTCPPRIGFR